MPASSRKQKTLELAEFFEEKYKPSSSKAFATQVMSLCARCGLDWGELKDLADLLLKHAEPIMEKILASPLSPSTKASQFKACAEFLKMMDREDEGYREAFKDVRAEYVVPRQLMAVKSAAEANNWVDWAEVLEVAAEQTPGTPQHVLMACLTKIPPRRTGEWGNLRVVRQFRPEMMEDYFKLAEDGVDGEPLNVLCVPRQPVDEEGNELQSVIFWGAFKTAAKYGTQIQILPESLSAVLRDYLFKQHVEPPKWLFHQVRDPSLPLGKDGVAALLLNCFYTRSKHVTGNMLRHSFVSHTAEQPYWESDFDKRRQIAHDMAHSVETQQGYVKR